MSASQEMHSPTMLNTNLGLKPFWMLPGFSFSFIQMWVWTRLKFQTWFILPASNARYILHLNQWKASIISCLRFFLDPLFHLLENTVVIILHSRNRPHDSRFQPAPPRSRCSGQRPPSRHSPRSRSRFHSRCWCRPWRCGSGSTFAVYYKRNTSAKILS